MYLAPTVQEVRTFRTILARALVSAVVNRPIIL